MVGLMGAIELVADKKTKKSFEPVGAIGKKAVAACIEEGLIIRGIGDSIALCPPLIIDEAGIDEIFDKH